MPVPYKMDIPPGRETRIFELKYLASEYGNAPEPKDWYELSLHVHSGDTIYAARRGRVTETRDDATLTDSNYSYAKGENYVEVSHNDCTFGRYTITSEHPAELITKEMSKKDAKRYHETHKSS